MPNFALEMAAGRGVVVRVLLDHNLEAAANQPAFDELTAMGVHVAWADSRYAATHEKALVVDGSVAAVMSLNLTKRYYADDPRLRRARPRVRRCRRDRARVRRRLPARSDLARGG